MYGKYEEANEELGRCHYRNSTSSRSISSSYGSPKSPFLLLSAVVVRLSAPVVCWLPSGVVALVVDAAASVLSCDNRIHF